MIQRVIERVHEAGGVVSRALYSECEKYRYALIRDWSAGPAPNQLLYIMLNPSRATEVQNDPTIERCERRARALGFGGFGVANVFAWRETHPRLLRRARAPVGADNDAVLLDMAARSKTVLAAWGVHGAHLGRGAQVEAALRAAGHRLYTLGLTKAGHPRHPLYVSYDTLPQLWD